MRKEWTKAWKESTRTAAEIRLASSRPPPRAPIISNPFGSNPSNGCGRSSQIFVDGLNGQISLEKIHEKLPGTKFSGDIQRQQNATSSELARHLAAGPQLGDLSRPPWQHSSNE